MTGSSLALFASDILHKYREFDFRVLKCDQLWVTDDAISSTKSVTECRLYIVFRS